MTKNTQTISDPPPPISYTHLCLEQQHYKQLRISKPKNFQIFFDITCWIWPKWFTASIFYICNEFMNYPFLHVTFISWCNGEGLISSTLSEYHHVMQFFNQILTHLDELSKWAYRTSCQFILLFSWFNFMNFYRLGIKNQNDTFFIYL